MIDIEVAKAQIIIEKGEFNIINAVEDGKRKASIGKIRFSDYDYNINNRVLNPDLLKTKWRTVWDYFTAQEGLKVELVFQHVGNNSWFEMNFKW